LFVVRCSLFVVCCSLFVVRCSHLRTIVSSCYRFKSTAVLFYLHAIAPSYYLSCSSLPGSSLTSSPLLRSSLIASSLISILRDKRLR
jgi:hypothetical protein